MTLLSTDSFQTLTFRPATPDDFGPVETVLRRSYPALLARDYSRSELEGLLPLMTKAQPALLESGTYWLAEDAGEVVAVGGWTVQAPGTGAVEAGGGHVRHVATDPAHVRRGIARGLMQRVMAQAAEAGVTCLTCLSTRTAVSFYASLGFEAQGQLHVPMGGSVFPAVQMVRRLEA